MRREGQRNEEQCRDAEKASGQEEQRGERRRAPQRGRRRRQGANELVPGRQRTSCFRCRQSFVLNVSLLCFEPVTGSSSLPPLTRAGVMEPRRRPGVREYNTLAFPGETGRASLFALRLVSTSSRTRQRGADAASTYVRGNIIHNLLAALSVTRGLKTHVKLHQRPKEAASLVSGR